MLTVVRAFIGEYWLTLTLAAGVIAVAGGIYLKGHSDGSDAAEQAERTAIFNQFKERNVTDEKVQQMSDPELCRAIGGMFRDDRCQ